MNIVFMLDCGPMGVSCMPCGMLGMLCCRKGDGCGGCSKISDSKRKRFEERQSRMLAAVQNGEMQVVDWPTVLTEPAVRMDRARCLPESR